MKLGMLKCSVTNKKVVPNVLIQVWHAGKGDYRVVVAGIGQYAQFTNPSQSYTKAQWLGKLEQADLNHELAKVQNENDMKGAAA